MEKQAEREEDRDRVDDVPEKEPGDEWQNREWGKEQREGRRVLEVVVRLVESEGVEVPVREQIPERRAEDCIIVREREDAALNRDDEGSGDVDNQKGPLIEGPPGQSGLQIRGDQENSESRLVVVSLTAKAVERLRYIRC